MNADQIILHAIADNWGGRECPRADHPNGVFSFRGDEGYSLYHVWRPGQTALLAEDNGRPFRKKVPSGKYLVRCMTDAPDCWWYVNDDGTYRTPGHSGVLLLGAPS